MALNIKNEAVEQLAAEVAALAGETKTEAIRKALLLRRSELARNQGGADEKARVLSFLEREAWPATRSHRMPTPAEQDEALGYGEQGV